MQSIQSMGRAGNREGLLFRGIVAIIFGILAIVWPGITLGILILLFGAYAIIDGIFDIVTAAKGSSYQSRELLLVEGIVSVVAGAIAFVWPGITALVFLYLLAAWAVVTGVMEVVAAFSPSDDATAVARGGTGAGRQIGAGASGGSDWWLAIAGIASIIFGILVGLQPRFGLLSVIWIIGIYALVFGVLFLLRYFQSLATRPRTATEASSYEQPHSSTGYSQPGASATYNPPSASTGYGGQSSSSTNYGQSGPNTNPGQTRTARYPGE